MNTTDNKQQAGASFVSIIPKEESEYDRMIREKQEAQMDSCCEGYSPYDQYGYKPRPKSPSQDYPANPESAAELPELPHTDKKTNKR